MNRPKDRRVPPANLVPQSTSIRSRSRDGRTMRRRRMRRYVGATVVIGAMMPGILLISYNFAFVALGLLLAMIMMERAVYNAVDARSHIEERSHAMIQDIFGGIFGQTGVPAPAAAPAPAVATAVPEEPAAPVPPPRVSDNPRIPGVARPVVLQIEAKIERILGAIDRHELGDMTPREMTDLRDVHLPALIASYVDIPADQRARIFEERKKSASYVLKESLETISEDLDETIARLAQRNISAFEDTNRFIADRYGKRKDPFQ